MGSGVSGLVCAHLLHDRHDVTVYEADDWIGGHVRTVPVEVGERELAVDMGFIVYNDWTYPNFIRLLERLGVHTQPSDMSFSVSCERTGLEYECSGADGFFSQRRNLLRAGHWRLLRDVRRFQSAAHAFLERPDDKVTLGAWLAGLGLGPEFSPLHLVPMGSAIWSARPDRLLDFPAATFLRFFANHGLLTIGEDPQWRVIRGGSREYVRALIAPFRDSLRPGCAVRAVRRRQTGVEVYTGGNGPERFDEVIFACHSDQALGLLTDPTPAERQVLGSIRYQRNEALLHTDTSWLPRGRRSWASWNVKVPTGGNGRAVVTYHMNRLQSLDAPVEFCVTLNPHREIAADRVIDAWSTQHPIFDSAAIAAQQRHADVSGVDRIHYCGAYWGYGFHEDGVNSALAVTRRFGAAL